LLAGGLIATASGMYCPAPLPPCLAPIGHARARNGLT